MKKYAVSLILLAVLFSAVIPALAIMPYAPQRTIGLHIGPKNPTFDESKYPDIDFYYMPKIKWAYNKPSGTPEAMVEWLNKRGIQLNQMILFDKKGVIDFTGFNIPSKAVTDIHDLGFLYTLGERLKKIVEEGRETTKENKKPVKLDWVSDIEGRKFPEFEIVNSSGEATTTIDIIEGTETPKLMIVFMIPYNYKFQEVEKHMEDVGDPLQALSAIAGMQSGEHHTGYIDQIEKELYNR